MTPDSLPAYEVLDEIVERHIEGLQSAGRIVAETGFDEGWCGGCAA
ncbi:MAG: hypothetical protein R3B49_10405 [Phycisphaerales bacterium]